MSVEFYERMLEEWLPGAMFPSEIWWLVQAIKETNPDVVIECGRQDGYSTRLLAELLKDTDIKIYSIDFDEDKARLERIKGDLSSFNVECVSGDIHVRVPEILSANHGARIAVVQDGPKGWEGMATLLASVYSSDVVLLAQHNLHIGHESRDMFDCLSPSVAFYEFSDECRSLHDFRKLEVDRLAGVSSNRAIDHSSLGVMRLGENSRALLRKRIEDNEGKFGVWNPIKVADAWKVKDFDYVSRLRAGMRFSMYRFKKR